MKKLKPGLYDENDNLICPFSVFRIYNKTESFFLRDLLEAPIPFENATKLVFPNTEKDIPKMYSEVRHFIKEIFISDFIRVIDDNAFEGWSSLEKVHISPTSQLERIGNFAFHKCPNLAEIDFPDSLTSIGQSAFEGCSSLKEMNFNFNSNLKEIYSFPDNVKEIVLPKNLSGINLLTINKKLNKIYISEETKDNIILLPDEKDFFYQLFKDGKLRMYRDEQEFDYTKDKVKNLNSVASLKDSVNDVSAVEKNSIYFKDNNDLLNYMISHPDVWNYNYPGAYGIVPDVKKKEIINIFYKALKEDKQLCLDVINKGYLEHFPEMGKYKKDVDIVNAVIDKFKEFDVSKKYDIDEISQFVSKLESTLKYINFKKERSLLAEKIDLSNITKNQTEKNYTNDSLWPIKKGDHYFKDGTDLLNYMISHPDVWNYNYPGAYGIVPDVKKQEIIDIFYRALKEDKQLCLDAIKKGYLEHYPEMGKYKKDVDIIFAVIDKFKEFDVSKKCDIEDIAQYPSKLEATISCIKFDKERSLLAEKIDLSKK